jgi:hypothetical protein|tara:strand:- start:1030 stop:1860 length:831 start_codon:yes stop_codon:yes gene_type:complete
MSEENEEQSFNEAFDELAEGESTSSEEAPESLTNEVDDDGKEEEGQALLLEEGSEETEKALSIEDQLDAAQGELQQWQHRYNSDLGRQNAYQRQLKEQQQTIEKLQQNSTASPSAGDNSWKLVAEDYPDIAEGVKSLFEKQANEHRFELDRVRGELQPIQEQARKSYVDQQFVMLENEHPDYREVAVSEEFKGWVATQPGPIQEMIQSEQAGDAAYLLRAYKNDVQPGQQATSELKQRREKQLRQGQTVPSRGGRSKSNLPPEDDFEAAFDFFASR